MHNIYKFTEIYSVYIYYIYIFIYLFICICACAYKGYVHVHICRHICIHIRCIHAYTMYTYFHISMCVRMIMRYYRDIQTACVFMNVRVCASGVDRNCEWRTIRPKSQGVFQGLALHTCAVHSVGALMTGTYSLLSHGTCLGPVSGQCPAATLHEPR